MNVHFSSKKHDWATPWPLFREWDERFGPFELDVCATAHNAKCKKFFSPEGDGLAQVWHGVCWMNPPYGRALPHWMFKAVAEVWTERARRVVCLLPVRTDTAWWRRHILPYAAEIHYLRGVSALKEPRLPRPSRAPCSSLKNAPTAPRHYLA